MDEPTHQDQVTLSLVERTALQRVYEGMSRAQQAAQEVGVAVLSAHGFDATHTIIPIDLERGIVQILTQEQAKQAQAQAANGV